MILPLFTLALPAKAHSPFPQKASRRNPSPHFSNCTKNHVTTVHYCRTSFHKKSNCILLVHWNIEKALYLQGFSLFGIKLLTKIIHILKISKLYFFSTQVFGMSTPTILQSFNSLVNVWRQNIQYFLAMETMSRWELSTGPSMKGNDIN